MTKNPYAPLLGLCCVTFCGFQAQALNAAELVLRDIRVTLEMLPADFDFTLRNELGTTTGSDEFDSGLGITVGGMYGFTGAGDHSGLLAGGEVTIGTYGFGSSGDYTTIGLRAFGGYGWQINDDWYVLTEIYAGYAVADMTFPTTDAFSSFGADGTNIDYGFRVGAGYVINEQWLVSANLGYGFGDADLESGGSQDIDLNIEQTGISFMLGVAYRFNHLPPRLE